MNLDETRLLQAYVDGELDPASAVALEARLAQNARLRSACERLRETSAAVRANADYHAAPAAFAARLRAALPDEPKAPAPRAWRWPALGWLAPVSALGTAFALGAGVAITFIGPAEGELVAREVIASHVRATLADRLIDVASSDQHTVKPWLSARLPFSPSVADYSGEGFPLVGARLEYVAGKPVAVLVYKRRRHTIDLFAWPGGDPAGAPEERFGFNVERFSAGGLQYWAVSDLNRKELEDFVRLAERRP
ncbi:MAG TPA: anti-sigma factor [Burkholderiales bacterium]|nr:anti-sigma factor [Burkholderiales bacterium]